MKKKIIFNCLSLGLMVLVNSCSNSVAEENSPSNAGEKGQLVLNLTASNEFEPATRAVNEEDYLNTSNYTIQVLDADGKQAAACTGRDVNVPISLTKGSYTVKAFYGEIGDGASTDRFYVEGTQAVTVEAAKSVSATVNCVAQAAKVRVNFDNEMRKYLSDYNVAFGGTAAMGTDKTIVWGKDQSSPIYFQIAEAGENLDYTINVTCKEDYLLNPQTGATTGSVERSFTVQRNKSYNINVNLNVTNPGQLELTIEIDESTNDKPLIWTVPVEWTK